MELRLSINIKIILKLLKLFLQIQSIKIMINLKNNINYPNFVNFLKGGNTLSAQKIEEILYSAMEDYFVEIIVGKDNNSLNLSQSNLLTLLAFKKYFS